RRRREPWGLFKPFRRQPAFGIERGHASGAGGGDRLPVVIVGDVSGGEDPLDTGVRPLGRCPLNVPFLVELELAPEEISIGGVADGGKVATRGQLLGAVWISRALDPHARHACLVVPQYLIDGRIPFGL